MISCSSLYSVKFRDEAVPMAEVDSDPSGGHVGCGATCVTTVFTAIPVIGSAAAVGLTVAGQQIVSLFVDRYGWFRLPKREISGMRFDGVAILLGGIEADGEG
jgi:uncharacterized membrane protein YdcZ (DUF606 family)